MLNILMMKGVFRKFGLDLVAQLLIILVVISIVIYLFGICCQLM